MMHFLAGILAASFLLIVGALLSTARKAP